MTRRPFPNALNRAVISEYLNDLVLKFKIICGSSEYPSKINLTICIDDNKWGEIGDRIIIDTQEINAKEPMKNSFNRFL